MQNLSSAHLVLPDNTSYEVDRFHLKQYAMNSSFHLDVTLISGLKMPIKPAYIATLCWEQNGKKRYFQGVVQHIHSDNIKLSSRLEIDQVLKTQFYETQTVSSLIKTVLSDNLNYQCHFSSEKIIDFHRYECSMYDSLLELSAKGSFFFAWSSESYDTPLTFLDQFKKTNAQPIILGKYGIEAAADFTVHRWREEAKSKILTLDTQDWLGDLGELISHPRFGYRRIVGYDIQKSRQQNPAITVTTLPLDYPWTWPVLPIHNRPAEWVNIHQEVNARGQYKTQLAISKPSTFSNVSAQSHFSGVSSGFHFPYASEEPALQHYVDDSQTPVVMGTSQSAPSSVSGFYTQESLEWTMDSQKGIRLGTPAQGMSLSPSGIRFYQKKGMLTRKAIGSISSSSAEETLHSTQENYSHHQESCHWMVSTGAVTSGQHQFLTSETLTIHSGEVISSQVEGDTVMGANQCVNWQVPEVLTEGDSEIFAPEIKISARSFECRAGSSWIRFDEHGIEISAQRIRCDAASIVQQSRQTVHQA